MYTIAIQLEFIAQHFLIGGDWGQENEKHSHTYLVEVQLEGTTLDQNGNLVDTVYLESNLQALLSRYRDRTLNELPEFEDANPSLERFARILCQSLVSHLHAPNLNAITVKLWEDDFTWGTYRTKIQSKKGSD
jgi:6-pyruvoyltetrahydropterin/6-carboxytetrahydropterin synthase